MRSAWASPPPPCSTTSWSELGFRRQSRARRRHRKRRVRLDAIDILNSTFEQNGNGSNNGDGDIVLFGFTGDALIKNVTIAGGANAVPTNANADTAIQINGRDPASYDVTQPIGNVVFDKSTSAAAMPRCWSISRATPISTAWASWTLARASPAMPAGARRSTSTRPPTRPRPPPPTPGEPGFFDDAAAGALAPNTVDLSNVTVINDIPVNVPLGHPLVAFNGTALGTVYSGTPVADNITGTAGIDVLIGRDGNDILMPGRQRHRQRWRRQRHDRRRRRYRHGVLRHTLTAAA